MGILVVGFSVVFIAISLYEMEYQYNDNFDPAIEQFFNGAKENR